LELWKIDAVGSCL